MQKRKDDISAIQHQFEKFRGVENELDFRLKQYEQAKKELEDSNKQRQFYAKEMQRISKMYDELVKTIKVKATTERIVETEVVK